VLVYDGRVRLAEPDKVYYVREDFDKAVMGGLGEILEAKVLNTALP